MRNSTFFLAMLVFACICIDLTLVNHITLFSFQKYFIEMCGILLFQLSSNDIEKLEEAKLKAKFPNAIGRPISGHSAFLQKRLAKGVSKYRILYNIKCVLYQ